MSGAASAGGSAAEALATSRSSGVYAHRHIRRTRPPSCAAAAAATGSPRECR
jgi:hypothetical protein